MQSKPKLESIINSCNVALISTDMSGKVTFINDAGEKRVNLKRAAVINRYVTEVLPVSGALVLKCLNTGEPQVARHIIGGGSYLLVNIVPLTENGKKSGAVCSSLSVPQLDRAIKQLEPLDLVNRQLRAIFDSLSDGTWIFDKDGIVLNLNKRAEKNNGIKAENVIGKSIFDFEGLGLGNGNVTPGVIKTKKQASAMPYIENTKKHLLNTGSPVFDENGELYLVVVNERDMTELNEIRNELQRSKMINEKITDELTELKMLELSENEIVADSEQARQTLHTALKLARLDTSSVLILGKTGTGKGMLANFIHQKGKRHNKPFIQINCAALPESLLEAELFGYERGAFTGAKNQGKAGLIELADGGTLFLDEIGDLPMNMQAKFLKYLDDKEIMRLGSTSSRKIDCNVISATNQNLADLVKERRFRRDLLYRLNSFTVCISPLRDRPDDILPLIHYNLRKYNAEYDVERTISSVSLKRLKAYSFPGNVRELSNIIRHAVAMSEDLAIDDMIMAAIEPAGDHPGRGRYGGLNGHGLANEMMAFEKKIISKAMRRTKTVREVASVLGISHPTAFRKMKKHGLSF
ncbi:MAG: sigma 54-interacting transcriptional regulator [Deltaproteobacteria bacterium]|nr:sigma 54-interacting transcriptional regulator [Deltaproteobacteria bacterium]